MNPFGIRPAVVKSLVDKLGQITAPTLVIWGRQDATVPVAQAEVLRQGIPTVTVHIFDHCGHGPMHEKADEFNRLVLESLA